MTERKNFTVRTRSIEEAMVDFPVTTSWSPGAIDADVLILAAGFEPRVSAFPAKFLEFDQAPIRAVLVGQYQTNPEDNALRFQELRPLLQKFSGELREVDADVPEDVLRSIIELSKLGGIDRIAFDISGASSSFIFSVVGAIFRQLPNVELTIFYAEAATYNQSKKVGDDSDSPAEAPEHGVASVWTNPIFQGRHQDSASSYIVAFPSLYLSRLSRCLNFCGEAVESLAERNVLWVLPLTEAEEHKWRRGATVDVIRKLVVPMSEDSSGESMMDREAHIDCHVRSPDQAARILLREAEIKSGRNIYLVHMGSKMQAIGAALALAAREEVSLVHARPERFTPSAYSDGIGNMYCLKIPNLGRTVKSMASVGQMVLVCADGTEEY
ncbi:hypothetical protein IB223_06480 [Pseudoxanthomonas sp. PXM03]|uniref:hypothetical protein n=1 Tax=Pseudoxanthomonas sp. PXM03 TaxID=2769284 RepID=UPI001784689C|nr:hypothetical protein [Pseudoxanthomonas sp. PXM03]MBD9435730.1 hypothetical protein [Pseudoxanthomonas sp. PXM03]